MKLYEINEKINTILKNCVDEETGELNPDIIEKLQELSEERNTKLENIALFIKNLNSDITELKAEEKKLNERRKSKENKVEFLKNLLVNSLDGDNLETARVKVSFRKSEQIQIDDETLVPDDFFVVSKRINKTDLKKALKSGETFEGVSLVEKQNIQIK